MKSRRPGAGLAVRLMTPFEPPRGMVRPAPVSMLMAVLLVIPSPSFATSGTAALDVMTAAGGRAIGQHADPWLHPDQQVNDRATGTADPSGRSAPERIVFEPSGFKAGGFFTSVTVAPGLSNTLILAGGNSGYHRSTDLGASFAAHNRDLLTLPFMRVASVAYHPTREGVVYGASGNRGENGGLARSTDDGLTWDVISTEPRFAGQDNSSIADLPEHPRSTGALIAMDDDTLWVGTFQQGVMRSTDDGRTWRVVGLPGTFIRSLVRHPTDPDILYVATWEEGVYETRDARGEVVTFEPVAGAPRTVEELTFVGDSLYAAAGSAGLFRLEDGRWMPLPEGVPAGSVWAAIAGIDLGGDHLLFAGCAYCAADDSGDLATVIRSVDGGASWDSVTAPRNLDLHVVGSGERWALADGVPRYMPDGPEAVVSQIIVKALGIDDDMVVLWAGRGGLWRSLDAGDTWAPAVNGISEANSEGMAIDPADPTRIVQGAAHFGLQVSLDEFRTVHVDALDAVAALAGHSHATAIRTAFDTTLQPASVIIAAGDSEDGAVGGIYVTTDPTSRDAWVDLGYTSAFPGTQPTSIAVGHDAQGERVLLAAAQPRGGLVRKVGDGPWQRVPDTDAFTKASPRKSDMVWLEGTSTIYVYDLAVGVYRSLDAGMTFELLWQHPSETLATGAVTAQPSAPGTVYVAADDGLYRLDGADGARLDPSGLGVTRLDERVIADAFLHADGTLWAVAHPKAGDPTTILVALEPSRDPVSLIGYTDDTLANTMVAPETMVVTVNGTVLVGGLRSGTLRGVPEW